MSIFIKNTADTLKPCLSKTKGDTDVLWKEENSNKCFC